MRHPSAGSHPYLPGYVCPMLPKQLSNGICSLNPGVDRLTLSVIMDFDSDGNLKSYRICESVIKSKYRMTYKNVSKIILTTPKTKNANREIPINKNFLEIMKKVKANKEDYVLTGNKEYIEPRTYRKYFNKVLDKININHFNFHSLRHTFATNCISLGVDYKTVSELLGHANVNITLNLYVHPRLSQKKKCIDLICKVFQEKVI